MNLYKNEKEIYGIIPKDRTSSYDIKEIILRLVDKSELEEYTKIYNDEFGEAKDPFQLERTGEYVNPMHGT